MRGQPVLFPRAYGVYIALAAMDVMLTTLILAKGGVELNRVAAWVFSAHGMTGASMFKFATVTVVLVACEMAGRYRAKSLGRALAIAAVVVSLVPVSIGARELGRDLLARQPLWNDQIARSFVELGVGYGKAGRSE